MTLACSQHDRTTSARNHAGITGRDLNHVQHMITPGTTGTQHNGQSNHTGTTGTGTTSLAQRALISETSACARKGSADHAPQPPTGLPFSRRERAGRDCQKTNDLAREAVGCNGVFGGSSRRSGCYRHAPTTPPQYHAV